jgi:EAL domain-containing protein (putative c-di-GMP-specific phosphodiesterase class I)
MVVCYCITAVMETRGPMMNFPIKTLLAGEQQFEHVYQPLWNLTTWNIFGYEALLRFKDKRFGNVESLFQSAREEGHLYELDIAAIDSAIACFPFDRLNKELLFVNIYPSTILHEQFLSFLNCLLNKYPAISNQLVFELNETKFEEEIWEVSELKERIQVIKNCGIYIAIDDVGKGASTLQKIIEFQPDYIKLDRYFAKELASNPEKQRMVALLANYCDSKITLVLEGIETEMDLAQAKLLKVPAAQGYILGEPQKM